MATTLYPNPRRNGFEGKKPTLDPESQAVIQAIEAARIRAKKKQGSPRQPEQVTPDDDSSGDRTPEFYTAQQRRKWGTFDGYGNQVSPPSPTGAAGDSTVPISQALFDAADRAGVYLPVDRDNKATLPPRRSDPFEGFRVRGKPSPESKPPGLSEGDFSQLMAESQSRMADSEARFKAAETAPRLPTKAPGFGAGGLGVDEARGRFGDAYGNAHKDPAAFSTARRDLDQALRDETGVRSYNADDVAPMTPEQLAALQKAGQRIDGAGPFAGGLTVGGGDRSADPRFANLLAAAKTEGAARQDRDARFDEATRTAPTSQTDSYDQINARRAKAGLPPVQQPSVGSTLQAKQNADANKAGVAQADNDRGMMIQAQNAEAGGRLGLQREAQGVAKRLGISVPQAMAMMNAGLTNPAGAPQPGTPGADGDWLGTPGAAMLFPDVVEQNTRQRGALDLEGKRQEGALAVEDKRLAGQEKELQAQVQMKDKELAAEQLRHQELMKQRDQQFATTSAAEQRRHELALEQSRQNMLVLQGQLDAAKAQLAQSSQQFEATEKRKEREFTAGVGSRTAADRVAGSQADMTDLQLAEMKKKQADPVAASLGELQKKRPELSMTPEQARESYRTKALSVPAAAGRSTDPSKAPAEIVNYMRDVFTKNDFGGGSWLSTDETDFENFVVRNLSGAGGFSDDQLRELAERFWQQANGSMTAGNIFTNY